MWKKVNLLSRLVASPRPSDDTGSVKVTVSQHVQLIARQSKPTRSIGVFGQTAATVVSTRQTRLRSSGPLPETMVQTLDYLLERQISRQWRGMLTALATEFEAQIGPAELRQLMYRVGG